MSVSIIGNRELLANYLMRCAVWAHNQRGACNLAKHWILVNQLAPYSVDCSTLIEINGLRKTNLREYLGERWRRERHLCNL
jgi:hypothetical protein